MTVSVHAEGEGFLYDRVSRHILDLVGNGTLKPGDRVPSLRGLSRQLKVSISTVSQAYTGLQQIGVLRVRPQSGYYVDGQLGRGGASPIPRRTTVSRQPRQVRFGEMFEEIFSVANDPRVVPLGAAVPATGLLPVKGLQRATQRALTRQPEQAVAYCFPPGNSELRKEIARRYVDLGLSVDPDDIVVTSGCSEALALSLQAVTRRGDIVAVESPCYFSVLRLIERMGLLAVEIDTDPQTGLCLDALENALDTMPIKAVVAVLNFGNPLGSLMPDANKRRLVEMLDRANVPLIDDDIYGDLHFTAQRPKIAKCYDRRGLVLTCSSFSKSIAPGYRVGWVVAEGHRDALIEWKQATSSAMCSLPQMAVGEYLRSGAYDRHLARLRGQYRQQVETMRFMLARHLPAGTRISDPQGGFVLWVELPRGVDAFELVNRALQEQISVMPGMMFSATRKFRNFIRVNCGNPWDARIERAVERLGQLVAEIAGGGDHRSD
ncbi:MAG: PLP-dependent aminotransferase family protein [Chromatiaceae bacterium]|nr:PLP-dependent aminotransferase family protein [Chromatiaceae bacterium]